MRAMIVSSSMPAGNAVAELLRNGSNIVDVIFCGNGTEARRVALDGEYGLIVINMPLKDEWGADLAVHFAGGTGSGVIAVVKEEVAEEVGAKLEHYGVMVLSKPLNPYLFIQGVRMVRAAQVRLDGLRHEKRELQTVIDAMRLIDRAKYLLMEREGLSEQEAHRCIEKQAMDARMTKRAVAEKILKEYEV